jgi:hypothetical protein
MAFNTAFNPRSTFDAAVTDPVARSYTVGQAGESPT